MTHDRSVNRRRFLKGTVGAAAIATLGGCDSLTKSSWWTHLLNHAQTVTETVQRAMTPAGALAKEYTEADLSAVFPANGTTDPGTAEYAVQAQNEFADWTVTVDGLVAAPTTWSLAALRELPARTQITRHDCVEGWSAIGQWTGVPLGELLRQAQPLPNARYLILHCADVDDHGIAYYESMALADGYHPQTILAYALNGRPLDIPHGAPLRLRFERQLGYKHAKYVRRIQVADSLAGVGGGRGGYWEDQGYEWYAGI